MILSYTGLHIHTSSPPSPSPPLEISRSYNCAHNAIPYRFLKIRNSTPRSRHKRQYTHTTGHTLLLDATRTRVPAVHASTHSTQLIRSNKRCPPTRGRYTHLASLSPIVLLMPRNQILLKILSLPLQIIEKSQEKFLINTWI